MLKELQSLMNTNSQQALTFFKERLGQKHFSSRFRSQKTITITCHQKTARRGCNCWR